eukprot:MONOS_16339.1-p1 / transcript=MONOS_16339.1 / gene=MONOS_16339 / organism=Monocercomonoides_exilis_PA203 / gene_product=unspecified product / transcript_product=unspecified product / location=Mono_scaffold01660:7-5624(-) / protein_length=1872 / sequence_SO=supercontig / SO=protein_coding / is_pseudo=false
MGVGEVHVVECVFGGKGEEKRKTNMWIVCGRGGSVELKKVSVEQMEFGDGRGMCAMKGGGLLCEDVNMNGARTDGGGLVIGEKGTKIVVKRMKARDCWGGSGGVIRVMDGRKVELSEECEFVGCCSGRGDGGAVSWEMSGEDEVLVKNCTVKNCRAEETGGRGGGVFMWIHADCENRFGISKMVFEGNAAHEGDDVFVKCRDLKESVVGERFELELVKEGGEAGVRMMGRDEGRFSEKAHDLMYFLVGYRSRRIVVGSNGADIMGCGREEYPCESFEKGVEHGENEDGMIEMEVIDMVGIRKVEDLSGWKVEGSSAEEKSVVEIREKIEGDGESWVVKNEKVLNVERVRMVVPVRLEEGKKEVVWSGGGNAELWLVLCEFEVEGAGIVEYSMVKSSGGKVMAVSCLVKEMEIGAVAFEFCSSVEMSGCVFEDVKRVGGDGRDGRDGDGEGGGVMRVKLKGEDTFGISNSYFEGCGWEWEEGCGGVIYVDSREGLKEDGLRFAGTEFKGTVGGARGKAIYIEGVDLNKTVNEQSFGVIYGELKEDENLFVGKDEKLGETDLLRLVVKYWSGVVYISEDGFDVMGCGSERDPCGTLWKGMKQIEKENEEKRVMIRREVGVEDEWDLSSLSVERWRNGEEKLPRSALVFGGDGEKRGRGVIVNTKMLVLKEMSVCMAAGFENGRGWAVENNGGTLWLDKCVFETREGTEGGEGEGGGSVFVRMFNGELRADELESRSMNGGKGLFEVNGGCRCILLGMRVESGRIRDGAVVQVVDGDVGNGDEGSVVEMENSTFLFVAGQGNRPRIVECKCDGGICVNVSGCVFESCKSSESEKGGVVYFSLNEGGWLRMSESTIKQSGCSAERGKGGGLYLHSEVTGELDFELRSMEFRGNDAALGRDVFVECFSIENQINETQFRLDLRESVYMRQNGMCGMDRTQHTVEAIDLMGIITIFQSDTIVVSSSREKGGKNERSCGMPEVPCRSIDYGVEHVTWDYVSQMFVEEESVIERECDFVEMRVLSSGGDMAQIIVKGIEEQRREGVIATQRNVEVTGLGFVFAEGAEWSHARLIEVQSGMLRIRLCTFSTMQNGEEENGKARIRFSLIWIGGGGCAVSSVQVAGLRFLETVKGVIEASGPEQETSVNNVSVADISVEDGSIICSGAKLLPRIGSCSFENITRLSGGASCILLRAGEGKEMGEIVNCTFRRCTSQSARGSGVKVLCASSIAFDSCTFDGCGLLEKTNWEGAEEGICFWNGSVVEMENCSSRMKDTVIANSSCGGAGVDGGDVRIEMGMFENNNGTVEKYRSIRRNVVCSGLGKVNVVSLKGGDGAKENSSLWILSEGCTLEGVAGERGWALFVPVVEEAHMRGAGEELEVRFVGRLLIPCNLSFGVSVWDGDAEAVERHEFVESDYVSEEEVCSRIGASAARGAAETAEVRVRIEFGDAARRQGTKWFVVKNRTEAQVNGNEKLVEGGNKEKSSWPLVVIIMAVVLFVILIIAVVTTVRWRKQKRRTEELEEIVEDTVRKDPKLIEMVTMEMSPEEQWKRAEREAEKKNEERIKKRAYDTNMQHSESSEHLLSESGSTEYILGRDSDKIPEWALEKVEEEEIQKRTPSPSISSTSTTSTTDSDSTFVRSESLCPTTSSMSNLVDGMACSSPHEKLIADLRDSLFMLVHGKNEKKEMAIGSLKEREMTAAQILFWVVNGALHSFNEMENPLQSLANLSPHIVLFSEQMVIVIALHSDCSDESDSDSSSIASSCTIATSSSDVSLMSERFVDSPPPSSAFEDDEGCRDEYKRWKAPELMGKKKMRATKESVVFSVGMMLWECLTLKIPFGDYSAEAAGQKIVNGERPKPEKAGSEEYGEMIKACLSASPSERW